MPSDEFVVLLWSHDVVEAELWQVGGDELLDDARTEAALYADRHCPWDRWGREPRDHLSARVKALTTRLDRARAAGDGRD